MQSMAIWKEYRQLTFFCIAGILFALTAQYNFLLFHGLAEMTSIGIGFGLFFITSNSRLVRQNAFLEILAYGLFFVAFIDLIHTFAYKGMGVFPKHDANLPTQLWIAGRYILAASFVTAPFFINKTLPDRYPITAYTFGTLAILVLIFSGHFPDMFIEGEGLTPNKILSEYAVCLLLGISAVLLLRKRSQFSAKVFRFLMLAIGALIASELAFTFYYDVYSLSNIIGHFLKLVGFFFIYKALVQTVVTEPHDLLLRQSIKRDREMEELVQSRTAELESIFQSAQIGLMLLRGGRKLHRCNQRLADILGYESPQEMQGLGMEALHTSEQKFNEFGALYYETLRNTDTLQLEYQLRRKGGEVVWCLLSGSALDRSRPADLDAGVLWVIEDLTPRKNSEKELKDSAEKFSRLFNVAATPMCHVAADGTILDINKSFSQTFGYTQSDLQTLDDWWSKAYPETDYRKWVIETWSNAVEQAKAEGTEIKPLEYSVHCKDGTTRNCIISGTTIGDHFLATFFDITERKKYERQMQDLLEALPAYVYLQKNDYGIAFSNHHFKNLFGEPGDLPCYKVIAGRDAPCKPCPTFEVFRDGIPRVWEWQSPQGTTLQVHNHPFTHADGTEYVMEMGIDITKRILAEQALEEAYAILEQQARELRTANEDLEQYASVVSHDLKTPLRAIHNYADFLHEDLDESLLDEDISSYLKGLTQAARQSEELVDDLLTLSRMGRTSLSREPIELQALVSEVVELMELGEDSRITVEDLPIIHGDITLMRQVIQNLLENGLKFNTSTVKQIRVSWEATPQGDQLCFTDNGIGIEQKYFEQIFKPFQRLHTAAEYEGTGIGLAIVKRAAQLLDGKVKIHSVPGEGSRFCILFPPNANHEVLDD